MCRVRHLTGNIIGPLRDKSFQAINCSGILTTKNRKQNTTYTLNTKKKQEKKRKTVLANRIIYTMIWYAFYNLQPGNGAGRILTAVEPGPGYVK